MSLKDYPHEHDEVKQLHARIIALEAQVQSQRRRLHQLETDSLMLRTDVEHEQTQRILTP